jgi:hypothetical protein
MFSIRRRHFLLATSTAAAVILTVCAVSVFHQRGFEDRWAKVHTGMSKDEVRQVLGAPDTIYAPVAFQADTPGGTIFLSLLVGSPQERWAYGHRRLLAPQPTFPYFGLAFDGFLEPEDDDHVIYFFNDSSVSKKRCPYRGPEAAK